jgi:hypothetical protein
MALLIGQQSAGTSGDFFVAGDTAAWPFTATGGVAVRMWAQLKVANPALANVKLGIYADDGAGNPTGSPLAVTGVISPSPTGTGLFFGDLTAPFTLVNGTTYHLAVCGNGEQVDIQGTTSATGHESSGMMGVWTGAGGMIVTPVIWAESASGPLTLDLQVNWNELGPSDAFGPDPFDPYDSGAFVSSSPQTVVLGGLGSAQAFGAITPVPGGVAVAITGLGSAQAFGVPKLNIRFPVSGLGSAQAFGVPTIAVGGVVVAITGLGSAQSFGVPQENIAFFVSGLGSAQAFGTPTVTAGGTNQNVAATGLGSAQAFGTVTPVPGGVIVTITGLGSAKAFGVPQENIAFPVVGLGSAQAFGTITYTTGGVTIAVTGLGSAQAFGFPSVTTPGGGPSFSPAIHGGRRR